ncbi:hypothetical protein DNU06_06620 [Putridiphycobacter roseus]|uniref:MAM domain-containing protein n=1 Tax=Putridiphycobacter roseus TaxID=2219161 RepID=A0A2W1NHU4_9FLAO|nr:T9SS type A sorting domain-containing protein [Putridiphycobacter roseus]PZE17496.1 hypothetical protein DNU06_06620 [Putridiphycobacter roseus]
MKKILLIFSALFTGLIGVAQVNIGSGAIGTNDQHIPIEPYYGYTYSQMIYTAAEINTSGDIDSLIFYKDGTSLSNSNDWTVYLGHTALNSFATTNSWIASTGLTQVFSGTVTQVGSEVKIVFSTTFTYNGTDNLVIAVDENASGYDSNADDFYCSPTGATDRAITYYNDITNPDPTSPPTSGAVLSAFVANVQIGGITQTCPSLTGLTANNITATTADLDWNAGSGTDYQVVYGVNGFLIGAGTSTTVLVDSFNVTGLTGGIDYQFYVRNICSPGDTTAWAGPFSFTTNCPTSYIPAYTQDFSNYVPNCWEEGQGVLGSSNTTFSSTTSSNWIADGFGNVGSTGSARMEIYSTGRDEWLISPTIDLGTGANPYQLQFDVALTNWINTNTDVLGADDTLAVVISTDNGVTWNTTNILQAYTVGNEPSAAGDFTIIPLTGYTGLVKFGFYAASSVSNVDVNVYIDNFAVVDVPSCPQPTGVSVTGLTSTTVDIAWTVGAANTVIEYGPVGFTQGTGTFLSVTGGTATITGLTPINDYQFYIKDSCGLGDESVWTGPVAFSTACPNFTPTYTEDFSNYVPQCWSEGEGQLGATNTVFSSTSSSSWIADGFANNGSTGAARMEIWSTGRDEWLFSPTIDLGTGATQYQVEFDLALTYYSNTNADVLGTDDTLAIVISTDNGVTWSQANILQQWDATTSSISNTGQFVAIDLSAYTGLVQFGFYAASTVSGGDVNVYIDNFQVLPIPSCPKPLSLMASNVMYNAVDVSWATGGAADVQIEYGPAGFTPGTGTLMLANSNPFNLTGLMAETGYDFYLRDICAIGDTSLWNGPSSFTTPCAPIMAPIIDDVEGHSPVTSGSVGISNSLCWDGESFGTIWGVDNVGGTTSGSTGPDGAHSGSAYFYLETSTGSTGDYADLLSPSIDVSGLTNPSINFFYHMYGASMDTMIVAVNDGAGWTEVWRIFGEQQTAGSDSWIEKYIPLDGFSGVLQVRVRGYRGISYTGDMAIDDAGIVDCPVSFATVTANACDSLVAASGMVYTASGTYNDTIMNAVGCDSIITYNVTILNATASSITEVSCGTYTAPSGMTYGTTGIYMDTIMNTAGCDSVITIDLTVNNTFSSITEVVCESYTGPSGTVYTATGIVTDTIANSIGCDSIITIDLTVNPATSNSLIISECDTYTSASGVVYTTTGNYQEMFTNAAGCDSTLYLDVTIHDSYDLNIIEDACDEFVSDAGTVYNTTGVYTESYTASTGCDSIINYDVTITTIDNAISVSQGVVLTADQTGASYQWLDCNNGNAAIAGETSQTFTAVLNGDYACEIMLGTCTKISDCISVSSVGINDASSDVFSIYPNPNNGQFKIEMDKLTTNTEVIISNAAGQVVYKGQLNQTSSVVNLTGIESGLYVVNVLNEELNIKKTLIIE